MVVVLRWVAGASGRHVRGGRVQQAAGRASVVLVVAVLVLVLLLLLLRLLLLLLLLLLLILLVRLRLKQLQVIEVRQSASV